MGNKQDKKKNNLNINNEKEFNLLLNKNNFDFQYVIGRGGFGKVWKVQHKKYKKEFACKEMLKTKVIDKRSEKSIKSERDLLSKMKHPFIVNMHYAFQDNSTLYLIMDYLNGGDLRYHISRMNSKKMRYTEEQAKFFIACVLLALDYTHTNNILHRDLKPENLVFDDKFYLRLTDYGIAKPYSKENYTETSGTPGYMSPEVMCAQNHTIAVDYFALGVLAYEFMFGYRPYLGKSRKEIKDKIMAKQVCVKRQDIPNDWSAEGADFINRLLQRKPKNRLGLRGAAEVKEHSWLKYYPWKDLYEKKIPSPFQHKIQEPFDARYCNQPDKLGLATKERYENILRAENFKDIFKDFYYYHNEDDHNDKNNSNIKKIYNPHQTLENNIKAEKTYNNSTKDIKVMTNNIESKFNKIKQMSHSGSSSSLLRQYKNISGGTSSSTMGSTNSYINNSNVGVVNSKISYNNNHNNNNNNNNINYNQYIHKSSNSNTNNLGGYKLNNFGSSIRSGSVLSGNNNNNNNNNLGMKKSGSMVFSNYNRKDL